MSQKPFRWGILGTGLIAQIFTDDVRRLPDHKVVAVGSRSQARADAVGDQFGVPGRHPSYLALVNDPDVDGIYIATHHPMHMRNTLLALNAGKAVLCEKPFSMSVAETEKMIYTARSKNLLLMEAMWTHYLPHMARVREILKSGTLGEIISIQADHGQWFEKDPEFRLYKPELGGGALFDLGIYPVSFASMVLGKPKRITAVSDKAFTGVDGQTSILLQYASGAHAVLTTTNLAATPTRAVIVGTEARLEIDRTFYAATSFTVISRTGEIIERREKNYEGYGLREEAIEFARCFREGLKESPMLPLDETLSIMRTIEDIKNQIGLTFPPFG
jgi:predicted dehydrogenase